MHQEPTIADEIFDEICRYVRFTDEDKSALQALFPVVRDKFADIVDAFYRRVGEHEEASRVLKDGAQIMRLRRTLLAWLQRLFEGPWDYSYFRERVHIGQVHVRVALPQHYMFTAMDLIRRSLHDEVDRSYPDSAARRRTARHAITKIIDIELSIMLESYRDHFLAKTQAMERREKQLLTRDLEVYEARYMAVVENAAALVMAVSPDGRVQIFNQKAVEVTGRSRDKMLGQHCIDVLCHPDDRDIATRALEKAFRDDNPPPFTARIVTASGESRAIRWHVTQLPGAEQAIVCVIGIDITEERVLEERTRRAERLAGLGTLAAGLAHEIRNPLNAANLQLQLVQKRLIRNKNDDRDRAMSAAKVVGTELERLAGLVQDFLAFARPSRLRTTRSDLQETIATVITLVEPEATQLDIALKTDNKPGPLKAVYDEERLKQVLLNLVRNAIEAAGPHGTVELRARATEHLIHIDIVDSGSGVPDGINIFEPFSTSKETGTGLGLPIVHRIVSDHGGDISYTRRDDSTVFSIELPVQGPPQL